MDMNCQNYVKKRMPCIGLGTYQIKDRDTIFAVVDAALSSGYRMFDTAQFYHNENLLGDALKLLLPKYGLTRENIFIISKLHPSNQGKQKAGVSIEKSLQCLGVEYLDLFLIHWPGAAGKDASSKVNSVLRSESWVVLEKAYMDGRLKSIGVSNYDIRHLEELLTSAVVAPAVNQCEYHPHFAQDELIRFCVDHGILFQAYSSFGSPKAGRRLLEDRTIVKMAEKYHCSVPQFLLSWAISQGISVLPRSSNPEHVHENFRSNDVVVSNDDIRSVLSDHRQKYCWDPSVVV